MAAKGSVPVAHLDRVFPGCASLARDIASSGGLTITGVETPQQAAWVAAALREYDPQRTLVVVAPTATQAQQLCQAISLFAGLPPEFELDEDPSTKQDLTCFAPTYFPVDRVSPYRGGKLVLDRRILRRRLAIQFALTEPIRPRLLAAPALALLQRYPPVEMVKKMTTWLVGGVEEDRDKLVEKLIAAGYRRGQVVEEPGEFAVRGGVIDVYSPLHPLPVRLETVGDEIVSVRLFDPQRQVSLRGIEEVYFPPVQPVILDADVRQRCRDGLLRLCRELEIEPSRRIEALLEEVDQGIFSDDVAHLMPLCYPTSASFFDLLPSTTTVLLYEPYQCLRVWQETRLDYQKSFDLLREQGEAALPPEAYLLSEASVARRLRSLPRASLTPVVEDDIRDEIVDAVVQPGPRVAVTLRQHTGLSEALAKGRTHEERVGPLVERIRRWIDEGWRVVVCLESSGQVKRGVELLRSLGFSVQPTNPDGLPATLDRFPPHPELGSLFVVEGGVSEGFVSPADAVALLSQKDVFGVAHKRRMKERLPEGAGAAVTSFDELCVGDYIVHVDYGVGVYRGLVAKEVNGVAGDFIQIDYLGGDRLYLPATRLDRVHRYAGAEGAVPRLDRMGGISWASTRSRVQKALRELARELLTLYAHRQARRGRSFSPPGSMFRQFEARFPFVETPHQEQAINDCIQDMQSSRIMDRLVCGDVGFGKTEVAMRAAYLSVLDGAQVAVLAPTTVLAFQHWQTFRERFAGEPVNIDIISRFRSPQEQKETLEKLAQGKVDILIGTHRLLSKDVQFRDLGLLVVDEEHRFGVRHKEQIRQIKQDVDCLTMTATPIPRTLNHAFVGLKDLSLIETAPQDRHAIRTLIVSFDEATIAEAIRKELTRGGQVFFLHNRVRSIHSVAALLHRLVPEARVAVAHGQMQAHELEEVFLDFVHRTTNVLVTTTIIESGIDIPRVNTIIIHRADHLGLAQLYQLRGRVGRSTEQAVCYLVAPSLNNLTPLARNRLATLMRFTELGSGFKIARHDMELRGTGALLGEKQSGFIDSVGLDLYMDMLEQAIAEAKGEVSRTAVEPDIRLPLSAFIPDDYIQDISQRLSFYKRFNACRNEAEVAELAAELHDRYGETPTPVRLLLGVMRIKTLLRILSALRLDPAPGGVKLTLSDATPLDPTLLARFTTDRRQPFRLQPDSSVLIMTPPAPDEEEHLEHIVSLIRRLTESIGAPAKR